MVGCGLVISFLIKVNEVIIDSDLSGGKNDSKQESDSKTQMHKNDG